MRVKKKSSHHLGRGRAFTCVTFRDRLEERLVFLAQVFHELRAAVPVPQGRV